MTNEIFRSPDGEWTLSPVAAENDRWVIAACHVYTGKVKKSKTTYESKIEALETLRANSERVR